MKKTNVTKALSFILCIVLIAAMALCTTGCSDNKNHELPQTSAPTIHPGGAAPVLGEGETEFAFSIIDLDGKETAYVIRTNETTVGAALLALGLIQGEDGAYGLYVTAVGGVALDYDKDGAYWAFYIDGEYAMSGVDVTDIVAGTSYAFKAEKA